MKDPDIRTYEKLDFYPQRKTEKHIYNTFKGFDGMKAPDNKNDFRNSYTYKHFKNNICKNDESKEEYLTKWIANILQDPLNKTRTAMILQSKQGCGKDFFVEFSNKLIGDEYYLITGRPDIAFGKFNKSLENKIICVFNETQGKDTYEINESIKDAITRNKINIERKGKDPITLNDATHYIFLSNNNNPVKIPPDDRRFFCIEVGEDNRNDTDFFSKVKKELDNKEYIKSFYEYFINIYYSGYSFYDNRPESESYELMRETNIPVLVRFLEDYIKSLYYEVENGKRLIYNETNIITATPFYNKFKDFKVNKGYNDFKMTQTKFGIDIKRFNGITYEIKKKTKGTNYIINTNDILKLLTEEYKIEMPVYNEKEDEILSDTETTD